MIKISVARDFSNVPAGRFYEDGPVSGQRFREKVLVPALAKGQVEICLDAEGYGSSFLEEGFGGLVRYEGFTESQLRSVLTFESDDDSLPVEIWGYISDAQKVKDK